MATNFTAHSCAVWSIVSRDGKTSASIVPELGGIVSSFVAPLKGTPRETLFLHPWFWDRAAGRTRGGIPFIFPICGRLERDGEANTYLFAGRRYQMPSHGFASRMPWHVVRKDRPDELGISFADSQATRQMYPFKFRLELGYRVEPGRLVCDQTYTNTGPEPMPFYAGFHPYFLTPPPGPGKAATRVSIAARTAFAYNERLTDIKGVKPVPRTPLSIASPKLHELLTKAAPPARASLRFPDGHGIEVVARGTENADLFGYLQFYTMEDQPFFCIEPWMGFPNALNAVAGAHWLAPRSQVHGSFSCTVRQK